MKPDSMHPFSLYCNSYLSLCARVLELYSNGPRNPGTYTRRLRIPSLVGMSFGWPFERAPIPIRELRGSGVGRLEEFHQLGFGIWSGLNSRVGQDELA